MLDSLLDQLARRRGIGDAYYDYRGDCGTSAPRRRRQFLAAMGCNVTDAGAVEREIAALDAERWQPHAPAVTVLRPGRTGVIVVAPADALGEAIDWRVTTAQGTNRDGRALPANWPKSSGMNRTAAGLRDGWLPLPEDLPLGQHSLQLCMRTVVGMARCSWRPPLPRAGRTRHRPSLVGLAVQLYTLRFAVELGHRRLRRPSHRGAACAAQGAAFVGLNPLHALFPSNAGHFRPYSPSTRHFLTFSISPCGSDGVRRVRRGAGAGDDAGVCPRT